MKKTRFFGKVMLIGLMSLSLLTGCGEEKKSVETKTATETVKSEKENVKKEITVGVTSFADTLEPTEQYFGWVVSRYAIGETLVKFDEKGNIAPSLAEDWKISEDGKEWRLKIRENVKFSDGTLLTPEIVKASIERSFEKNGRAETYFRPVSITVDGQYIVIKTEKPVTILPATLADPLFIIVNTEADTSTFALKGPICTGPYIVESFNPTEECVVVKNKNYWGGEVPLDRITYKCINDQATRSMALQTGEIQIAYNLKVENLVDFQDESKYNIQSLKSLRTTFAFMNQNGVLKDKVLRQAVSRSLNKDVYCKILLEGGATPGKAPVPPTLDYGFDQLIDENSYNPESAKAILKEAGYKDIDGDGFVETPEGKKIELDFVIYTSREELKIYAQAAQISMKEVGINAKINTVSYETLLDLRDASKFDMLIWNVLVANTGDPESYLRENWYSRSVSNQTAYNNPEVDRLLDELSSEFDKDKRKELIIQIQQIIMNDIPTIFFGYETTYLITTKNIENAVMYPTDYYWITSKTSLK